jgi:SNF2 family DNA or RNA helicase
LAGLTLAGRLCPAIQRSLRSESPEEATMTPQEAYTFLRETARLLEGAGFGVLVPPWWNKPDARLRVRARLQTIQTDGQGSGILNMDSLVAYDWELALGDEPLNRDEFERLAALKTPLVRVRGRWVLLQPDQVETAIAFWERQRQQNEMALRDALGLMLGTETQIDGLDLAEVELDPALSGLMETLTRGERLEMLPPPPGFVGQLRPYQVRGYSWLAFLRRWGFGACLADDMGLGKTIQAITLLLRTKQEHPQGEPSLVICPTSLVGNWQREVARFAPELRVMVHHGAGRAEGAGFMAQSRQHDLVISTYGLVRRDIDDLIKVRWSNIILDEAQNIKNPLTKQARAARQLVGDYRVALTGTPVENHLTELWSILSFLNPGYLGSGDSFRRSFAVPIERYQDQEAAERLRRLVRPFVLRRLKTDPLVIQDLPDKFEYKVYCNLTREQATLYEAVVRDAMDELRAVDQGEAGASSSDAIKRRGLVLSMLTRLKQICNHPALFLGDGSETAARSGKLNRLCEMLEEVLAVGDRALIFTQFAQMGLLLQRHLRQTFGQEVYFLHGGTPQKQRDRMLLSFQEQEDSPALFVLSLKAGGTGLNLMRANHVFHYDRWWNPAVENQATDRAYRIGQTRDVQVSKFVCLGTLEEKIDALIESKSALAESVVGPGEESVTELSTDELYDLLALRKEAVETT